jgi:hypothetical protein
MRKAIYAFSFHGDQGTVGHQNFVPEEMVRETGLKANEWLVEVKKVIGGKVSHCSVQVEWRVELTRGFFFACREVAVMFLRRGQGTALRRRKKP